MQRLSTKKTGRFIERRSSSLIRQLRLEGLRRSLVGPGVAHESQAGDVRLLLPVLSHRDDRDRSVPVRRPRRPPNKDEKTALTMPDQRGPWRSAKRQTGNHLLLTWDCTSPICAAFLSQRATVFWGALIRRATVLDETLLPAAASCLTAAAARRA